PANPPRRAARRRPRDPRRCLSRPTVRQPLALRRPRAQNRPIDLTRRYPAGRAAAAMSRPTGRLIEPAGAGRPGSAGAITADDPTMNTKRRVQAMRWLFVVGAMGFWSAAACAEPPPPKAEPPGNSPRIAVRFGEELSDKPLDGRLLVMLSTEKDGEPRFQI